MVVLLVLFFMSNWKSVQKVTTAMKLGVWVAFLDNTPLLILLTCHNVTFSIKSDKMGLFIINRKSVLPQIKKF